MKKKKYKKLKKRIERLERDSGVYSFDFGYVNLYELCKIVEKLSRQLNADGGVYFRKAVKKK